MIHSYDTSPNHHSITKSSPDHHLIITSSSPHHHQITITSSPTHHQIITIPSPHHHQIITKSSPDHHQIMMLLGCFKRNSRMCWRCFGDVGYSMLRKRFGATLQRFFRSGWLQKSWPKTGIGTTKRTTWTFMRTTCM